jgi:acyl dehydratase
MPTITRLYGNPEDAARAVDALKAAGIAEGDISLIASHSGDAEPVDPDVTRTASEARSGEAIGAAIGGGAGLLAGLGVIAVPGIGLLVAAGWLVAAVTGAIAGAAAGSLAGALIGAGMPEEDAHRHVEDIRRGAVLISVRASAEQAAVIAGIMDAEAPHPV